MKGIAVLAFFLFFGVLLAVGLVMGTHGNSTGWWLTVVSFVAYLGVFIKAGCLSASH